MITEMCSATEMRVAPHTVGAHRRQNQWDENTTHIRPLRRTVAEEEAG